MYIKLFRSTVDNYQGLNRSVEAEPVLRQHNILIIQVIYRELSNPQEHHTCMHVHTACTYSGKIKNEFPLRQITGSAKLQMIL